MDEGVTDAGAVAVLMAVILFWLWQFLAWVVAIGRWERRHAGILPSRRYEKRPRFMGDIAWYLACSIRNGTDFLRTLGTVFLAGLPVLIGSTLLLFVLAGVAIPLIPRIGFLGGLLAAAVVYGGVAIPFMRASYHLRSRA